MMTECGVSLIPLDWVAPLRLLLAQQLALYQQVISALIEKQRILIANDIPALLEIDAQLRQLRQSLLKLEQERLTLLKDHQLEATPALSALLLAYQSRLSTAETRDLRQLQTDLKEALSHFQFHQLQCERLLGTSLLWIRDTIALVTEDDTLTHHYDGQGQQLSGYVTAPRPLSTDRRA